MAAPVKKRGLGAPSERLEAIPPYMFAELERRVEAKREEGIDVISLGIGDPDTPTFRYVVEAMREAVGDPSAQKYPSNRGRVEFRQASRSPTSALTPTSSASTATISSASSTCTSPPGRADRSR
jgi:aspartate/methionine/tyrosine aminotransferase